jgi:peptidyl-prolyl cis-trans isomerase C
MSKSAKFFGAALLALSLASPLRAADLTAETVIATVNGENITLGQMIAARKALPEQYQQLPDDVLFKGLLEQLIQQTAMAQVGEKNKTQLDDLNVENQKRAYFSGQLLEAAASAAVTEEALKKTYDEKYAKAVPAKEYDASHILVKTEEEAKAIKAELDKGGDFAAIAKEKSEDKGTAANGGSLGWFGVGMMVKPFEDAVVALEKGKTSDPVKSDFGWHIIHLNDVRDAAVPKLEDVKAELEGDLRQKAVEAKVKELTDAAKVEKKDDGVDPAILKNLALIGQ